MSEVEDLYRDIIVDHSQSPRNQGPVESPSHQHQGYNPLCGDEVELQLRVEDGKIVEVRFQGSGCSISQASASMLTQQVAGLSVTEALALSQEFRTWMQSRQCPDCPEHFGDLEALSGVRTYPARVKCATLAWSTLEQALA